MPPLWHTEDDMIQVSRHIVIPESELTFSFARSGGPGGQNVNKVSTKAVLRWSARDTKALPPGVKARFLERYRSRLTEMGELVLTSDRYRSQLRNKEDCLERLASLIRGVLMPPKVRRATKPTKASKRRRLDNKKKQGEKKRMRKSPRFDD